MVEDGTAVQDPSRVSDAERSQVDLQNVQGWVSLQGRSDTSSRDITSSDLRDPPCGLGPHPDRSKRNHVAVCRLTTGEVDRPVRVGSHGEI